MTEPIVVFLLARLAEDEAAARANIRRLPGSTTGEWYFRADERGMQVRDAGNDTLVVRHTWPNEGEHIVRHDPARTLVDIETKRDIIAEMVRLGGDRWLYLPEGKVLRCLAMRYADHPDHRAEWRIRGRIPDEV